MFYRDFILTVDRKDRLYFMEQLMTLVHDHFSQLNCALAFPGWAPAEPNKTDSFDTFTRYADMGDVVRIFSEHEAVLAAAERVLGVEVLLQRRILIAMPVKPVPAGARAAAYCRVRSADSLKRRMSKASGEAREGLKDAHRARCHEMALVRILAPDGKSTRPLYFNKVVGESVSPALASNSFGLSSSTAPCFLPDF